MFDSIRALLAGAIAVLSSAESHLSAVDPNALWEIVHGRCVVNEIKAKTPVPCVEVDLSGGPKRGYAVLKDLVGPTQYLVIPTRRIEGIESPELLAPDAPNYWQDAWQARHFTITSAHAPLTRDDLGLAVNSRYARSQNQLHIHVDCLRPDVKKALHRHEAEIGAAWSPLDVRLAGSPYLVRRLGGSELGAANPFRLLAKGVAGARAHMGEETLAVAGAVFADGRKGFYLLSERADLAAGRRANGELLLDHACALAKPSP